MHENNSYHILPMSQYWDAYNFVILHLPIIFKIQTTPMDIDILPTHI